MANLSYTLTVSGGSVPFSSTVARTGDGPIAAEVSVTNSAAVGSWVKSDANTGAGALTEGHGLSSGKCDVYWTGGRRYDVDATIAVNAIGVDAGTGDDYPDSDNTTVVVCMHQQVNLTIDGDSVNFIALLLESTTAASTARGHIHCEDADGDVIADVDLDANEPRLWDFDTGVATNDDGLDNPFAGDIITTVFVTTDSASETITLKVAGLQDITP
jgi:hypothetical protein